MMEKLNLGGITNMFVVSAKSSPRTTVYHIRTEEIGDVEWKS